jgi:hypothetical protein
MSNVTVSQGFAPTTLEEAMKFSELLAKSSMVPRQYQGKPEDVMVACQWGREIGLAPMQALQNIAVINGKPSVYGDAAMALVQASPVCEDIEEFFEGEGTPNPVAVCVAKRKGRKEVVVKFSVEDAKRAGLWGKQGPWSAYPKRMLQMRARGFALRDAFPDVLKGLITAEEAQDFPSEAAKDITPAKPANPLDVLPAPAAMVIEPEIVEPPELVEANNVAAEVFAEADSVVNDGEVAEVVEVAEVLDRAWLLHIPGKEPQRFSSQEEWSKNYELMADKVMASKLPSDVKLAKLDDFREINQPTLKRIPPDTRINHTQAYAKRKESCQAKAA